MLSTEATARLLVEIATGNCVTVARSAQMLELLARDPATKVVDPDDQAKFTGPALPPGAKLWSKAGWTSKTRHDAVLVELPDGGRYVLVTYTTDHSSEREIIRSVAKSVFAALGAR
jgi:beta-lactamase class A